ncbi:MAG: Txe/YoeB family addiction module toxin [Bacteroidales bacterium]|jgi:toxin YoeB|nr:Txe/YoeB family addiction module toxin [Bacteroidales bacterium]
MEIEYRDTALEDLEYWKKSGNKQVQKKIEVLLQDILKHPDSGLGQPEKLKHELAGYSSRRIDKKNRLVYRCTDEKIIVLSLRGHYFN